ncbi:hypothetical protein O1L68_29920 [Streptomyces lydicus]|nr:hypothetical protein [Streptomyces lydicus]
MRRTVRGIPAVHGIPAPRRVHRSRAALGTLTAAGTLLALLLPAGSAAATGQHSLPPLPAPRTAADAFWTADRMRSAVPLDLTAPAKHTPATAVPRGAR